MNGDARESAQRQGALAVDRDELEIRDHAAPGAEVDNDMEGVELRIELPCRVSRERDTFERDAIPSDSGGVRHAPGASRKRAAECAKSGLDRDGFRIAQGPRIEGPDLGLGKKRLGRRGWSPCHD